MSPSRFGSFNRTDYIIFLSLIDFSVRGGHADGAIGRKAIYIEGLARELRIPLIRLVDGSSGGGSVAVVGKAGYSKITSMVRLWLGGTIVAK